MFFDLNLVYLVICHIYPITLRLQLSFCILLSTIDIVRPRGQDRAHKFFVVCQCMPIVSHFHCVEHFETFQGTFPRMSLALLVFPVLLLLLILQYSKKPKPLIHDAIGGASISISETESQADHIGRLSRP